MTPHFSVLKLGILVACIWALGLGLAWYSLRPQRIESAKMKSVEVELHKALLLPNVLWVNASNSLKNYTIPEAEVVSKADISSKVYQAIGAKRPVVIFCDPFCYSSYTAALDLRSLTGSLDIFALKGGTSVLESYAK